MPPQKKEKRYLLFGYGSLNVPIIEGLTGTQLPFKPQPAFIKNHVRIFAGYSEYWKGAVASIHPHPGRRVYGSVVYLTKAEIASLDEYEGVSLGLGEGGYSRVKRVVYVQEPIRTPNSQQPRYKKRVAYVYIRNETDFEAPPSEKYLNSIRTNLSAVGNLEHDNIPLYAIVSAGKPVLVQIVRSSRPPTLKN